MLLFVHYFRRYQLLGVPMGRPLDKKQAVLYGQFVHAAYNMFKRDPTQLRPQPATGDIPDPYELVAWLNMSDYFFWWREKPKFYGRSEEHTSELQSRFDLVCRLLLEKKKNNITKTIIHIQYIISRVIT